MTKKNSLPQLKCVRCLLGDTFHFTIFGILCVSAECEHFGNFAKCKIHVSPYRLFLTLFGNILVTLHIMCLLTTVYSRKNDPLNIAKELVADLVCWSAIICHMVYVREFKDMLMFMQDILNQSVHIPGSNSLDPYFRFIKKVMRSAYLISPILFLIYLFLVLKSRVDECNVFITSYTIFFRTFVLLIHDMAVFVCLIILNGLVDFSCSSIKRVLEFDETKSNGLGLSKLDGIDVVRIGFHFYQRVNFYKSVVILMKKFSIVYSGLFVCMFAIYLPDLSINLYLIVTTRTVLHPRYALCFALLTLILLVLHIGQKIYDTSDDILSFLFKYPISKLTPGEAAQVEMLITTLTLHRPILKASDIFTVGTRLLASISGTVVTYVLVALQFHASWAD